MTVPVSTVPSVVAYLLAQIPVTVADSSVLVVVGPPGTFLPADFISIGAVQRRAVELDFGGSTASPSIQEAYSVEVICSTFQTDYSTTSGTVDGRAWVLASAVETTVRNDPSLGGRVFESRPGVSRSLGPQWEENHKGVLCDVVVTIDCEAII